MDDAGNLFLRLEQLNAIGAALSKERDINRLLEGILVAAKTITHAGCTSPWEARRATPSTSPACR